MRTHWKKVVLLLAGIAIAACLLFALPSADPEPSYQGLKLSQWIVQTNTQAKAEALLHMGTNALPHLLKWALPTPSKWRTWVHDMNSKHRKTFPKALAHWADRPTYRAIDAVAALNLLGTNAYVVLPELNRMATNTNNPSAVDNALGCSFEILYGDPAKANAATLYTWWSTEQRLFLSPDPAVRQAATNVHRLIPPRPNSLPLPSL